MRSFLLAASVAALASADRVQVKFIDQFGEEKEIDCIDQIPVSLLGSQHCNWNTETRPQLASYRVIEWSTRQFFTADDPVHTRLVSKPTINGQVVPEPDYRLVTTAAFGVWFKEPKMAEVPKIELPVKVAPFEKEYIQQQLDQVSMPRVVKYGPKNRRKQFIRGANMELIEVPEEAMYRNKGEREQLEMIAQLEEEILELQNEIHGKESPWKLARVGNVKDDNGDERKVQNNADVEAQTVKKKVELTQHQKDQKQKKLILLQKKLHCFRRLNGLQEDEVVAPRRAGNVVSSSRLELKLRSQVKGINYLPRDDIPDRLAQRGKLFESIQRIEWAMKDLEAEDFPEEPDSDEQEKAKKQAADRKKNADKNLKPNFYWPRYLYLNAKDSEQNGQAPYGLLDVNPAFANQNQQVIHPWEVPKGPQIGEMMFDPKSGKHIYQPANLGMWKPEHYDLNQIPLHGQYVRGSVLYK